MDCRHIVLQAVRGYLARDRWPDQLLLDLSEYMLAGHLVVRYGHVPKTLAPLPELKFTPETINWEMEWPPITNTCQLYLHFLEPMRTLVHAYEIQPRVEFIDLAVDITRSWLRYATREEEVTRFTWYDHCAAERTGHLLYLAETINRDQRLAHHGAFVADLQATLVQHATFLAAPENYTQQNHGTMMDRSLYLTAQYLSDDYDIEHWRTTALGRLQDSFVRAYSADMVNLENSSSYHLFNFDLFVGIEKDILNVFDDTLGKGFDLLLDGAVEFLVQLSKPDSALPMIGDGSRTSLTAFPRHPSYTHVKEHPHLRYVLTQGREGSPPSRLFSVYQNEGYAFARTSWDPADKASTYASFRAGRLIDNHKHADDLSFSLFAHGTDIFVDSGTYTYQPGDFRNYFVSAMAHNTIVVDRETYPIREGAANDAAIVDFGSTPDYHYVIGRNCAYRGVRLLRSFFFLPTGRVVIIDNAESGDDHTYSQLFHLSHRLDPRTLTVHDGGLTTVSADRLAIRIIQARSGDAAVHRGAPDRPDLGIVSEAFNVLHPTTTIEYQQHGRVARFVTVIAVDVSEGGIPPLTLELKRRSVHVRDGQAVVVIPHGGRGRPGRPRL